MEAYITDTASFLPNAPVSNEDMEDVIGGIGELSSRIKRLILRNNKITERYYALDPKTGRATHNNAQLTAEAVRRLAPYEGFKPEDIECLCCGTSSPDQLMPGHGLMVKGELGGGPCEVMTTSGICLSGITALKYAMMNVASGLSKNAVATGSEVASSFMRSSFFNAEPQSKTEDLESNHALIFDADFLRWMLSDGSGAVYISGSPATDRLSFRVDWIEVVSFAGEFETCMYAGASKQEDGTLTGWREFGPITEAARNNFFAVKQDANLLNKMVTEITIKRALPPIIEKHGLTASEIDWLLPHYSSNYFRKDVYGRLDEIGFMIPYERWFTNLASKGNTGSAAFYIMLDELYRSGKLEKGHRLLCFVPESGRFSVSYILLSVV
jgi:3-oxoacyl-[acyl-carrier-protein] synthase-3